MQRAILTDAMDVHGGKTVTLGPKNYLGIGYSSSAVSITVEGANIMTRSLMIFGQGAIRCHPYVLQELAAKNSDDAKAFDRAVFSHVGLVLGNATRALTLGLGIAKPSVPFDDSARRYAQALSRFSAAFGLCSDAAMATLGGELKMRELISARLGDMLSNLYLASMVLKRWQESEQVEGEQALMEYSLQTLLHRTELALSDFLDNLPAQSVAMALRVITLPLGKRWKLPADTDTRKLAKAVSTDSAIRRHLIKGIWNDEKDGGVENPVAQYNGLLKDYDQAEPLYRKISKAYAKGELPEQALHPEERFVAAADSGLISAEELTFMQNYEAKVLNMLMVDDFAFDAFAKNKDTLIKHNDDQVA
jgi:acyl-CoA dehydrogenase